MMHEKKFGQILKNWKFSVLIGREIGSINQKSRKVKFWKTVQVNAETPQSTLCYNNMHKYEMKSFSKTLEFNPNLPKTRFSINLSSMLKH